MLSKERIAEAEIGVRAYLAEGLLRKTQMHEGIKNIFLQNAKESLRVAEAVAQQKLSDIWVIVCSYYSMYYYTNAALLKLGYKVGDKIVHKVTADALIVYVRGKLKESFLEEYDSLKEEATNLAGIKADDIIESFDLERNKRNFIQYKTISIEKLAKAKTSLQRAKEFTVEMEKLLFE